MHADIAYWYNALSCLTCLHYIKISNSSCSIYFTW